MNAKHVVTAVFSTFILLLAAFNANLPSATDGQVGTGTKAPSELVSGVARRTPVPPAAIGIRTPISVFQPAQATLTSACGAATSAIPGGGDWLRSRTVRSTGGIVSGGAALSTGTRGSTRFMAVQRVQARLRIAAGYCVRKSAIFSVSTIATPVIAWARDTITMSM